LTGYCVCVCACVCVRSKDGPDPPRRQPAAISSYAVHTTRPNAAEGMQRWPRQPRLAAIAAIIVAKSHCPSSDDDHWLSDAAGETAKVVRSVWRFGAQLEPRQRLWPLSRPDLITRSRTFWNDIYQIKYIPNCVSMKTRQLRQAVVSAKHGLILMIFGKQHQHTFKNKKLNWCSQTRATRLEVSQGHQTQYHSTCYVHFLFCNSNFVFKTRRFSDIRLQEIVVTSKSGSEVTQGHWKWYHSIDWVWFPIIFNFIRCSTEQQPHKNN